MRPPQVCAVRVRRLRIDPRHLLCAEPVLVESSILHSPCDIIATMYLSAAAISSSPAPEALTVMEGDTGQSTSDHANADQICLDEDQVTGVTNDFTEPS